jgi:hypothetical protein
MMLINLPLSTAHSPAAVAAKAVRYGLRVEQYEMRGTVWVAEVHGGTPGAQRGVMALAEYFGTHVYAGRPDGSASYHPARGADPAWRMLQPTSGDSQ